MMLKHMRLYDQASNIEQAVFKTLAEGKSLTADLGGRASNSEYTKSVIGVSYIYKKVFIMMTDIPLFYVELEIRLSNLYKILNLFVHYFKHHTQLCSLKNNEQCVVQDLLLSLFVFKALIVTCSLALVYYP